GPKRAWAKSLLLQPPNRDWRPPLGRRWQEPQVPAAPVLRRFPDRCVACPVRSAHAAQTRPRRHADAPVRVRSPGLTRGLVVVHDLGIDNIFVSGAACAIGLGMLTRLAGLRRSLLRG